MVLAALSGVGGVEYSMEQACENPSAFMTLVGKVLPMQLTGQGGKPVAISVITGVPRPSGSTLERAAV
jgi:hypothetical protein